MNKKTLLCITLLILPILGVNAEKVFLTGGNWKLQRANEASTTGEQLSQAGFNDKSWIVATVPGTVLTSYLNNGLIPDPNFGDQQLLIDDEYFTADFWYRNSFVVPKNYAGKNIFLNFDGINWKADVFVNGNNVGRIEGAFIRGKFDITPYVKTGETAYLAVFIHKNDTPGEVSVQSLASAGPNGGALGADNPTFHASVGWDWLPTIRGRNIGIHDNVYLSAAGAVSIENPFVKTNLRDNAADLTLLVDLQNNKNVAVNGTLKGKFVPTNVTFSQPVSLSANELKTVTISDLFVEKLELWYPNGYGEQFLYDLELTFEENKSISDIHKTKFGIREITTDTIGGVLTLYVNGKRIFLRGGNWGLSESMIRFGEKEYDNCVRLHKEANFTMIRNWVGMTGSDYFYKACDKYGILIWDDFWLANPGDGPNPNDEMMFIKNARDKVKRVRNHPSVALYSGRNEGYPPPKLNAVLQRLTRELDGTRIYIPNSAADVVSGWGPYGVQNPRWYFSDRAAKDRKIHTEIGMPNVPSVETMRAMMPEEKLWPINDMWGIHDFCYAPSAMKADEYIAAVNKYGTPKNVEEFVRNAQMVNMENHKAMFESYAAHHVNGILMWMSHPAWPTTVWQTYDYFLEQTAGYYGCKKACEPLSILWDANDNQVKVVNNTGITIEPKRGMSPLQAMAYIYNMDGTLIWSDSLLILSIADDVKKCFEIPYPATISPVHFIKLKLMRGNEIFSDNFYWRATEFQHYAPLQTMEKVTPFIKIQKNRIEIKNPTSNIALMMRLKFLDENNERILPVFWSDNYFSLLPYETKTITFETESKKDFRLIVEGWNVDEMEIK